MTIVMIDRHPCRNWLRSAGRLDSSCARAGRTGLSGRAGVELSKRYGWAGLARAGAGMSMRDRQPEPRTGHM